MQSPGYGEYRRRFILQTLADPAVMRAFETSCPLPERFGRAVDERCVEYPWALSRMRRWQGSILDAGSTFNHDFLLESEWLNPKDFTILTLAPEADCFWYLGVSYLFSDLRFTPLRDASFDNVVCLSTLEHVGFDNSLFGAQGQETVDADAYLLALREIRRVLKTGGRLLLTVPFGQYETFRTCQIFDATLIDRATAALAPFESLEATFYRYSPQGWQVANRVDCRNCRVVAETQEGRPSPPQLDGAKASRAVACLAVTF